MSKPSKTAIIADDHAFTVSGMVAALGNLNFLGSAQNGIEAISLIKAQHPDCAILDYAMPGATGLEVMFEGRRWSPDTRFVIVTGGSSQRTLNELIAAKVDGLFLKTDNPAEIRSGVAQVLTGAQVISPAITEALKDAEQSAALTARELEVLQAVARGLSNPQIAEHLGVSAKTVDSHRTSLMRKLGVRSTAQLLVRAMKDELIDV